MERLSTSSFEFFETVGNGAFGQVLRARKKDTGDVFAVKVVEKRLLMREGKAKQAQTEKNVLARLKGHPGIVRLHFTFQDETNLYFVLEFCPGGDLAAVIQRYGTSFPYALAVLYAAEIVSMLEYLHSNGVVHRDLKPENLLLSATHHLRLTDFGTALDLQDRSGKADSSSAFVGTAEYVSPEVIRGEPAYFGSDLWALGCIIYSMLVGRPPFKAANEYLIFEQIRSMEITYPEDMPPVAVDLIQKLLVTNPEMRIGMKRDGLQTDYATLKSHPFFALLDFSTIYTTDVPTTLTIEHSEAVGESDLEAQILNKADARITATPVAASSSVIISDLVKKKAGWIYKTRRLTVTNEPSIRYYDPSTEEQKGEIEVVKELQVVCKSKTEFQLVLPRRTYFFKDLLDNSARWEVAIRAAKEVRELRSS